jgi:hypothetical protein
VLPWSHLAILHADLEGDGLAAAVLAYERLDTPGWPVGLSLQLADPFQRVAVLHHLRRWCEEGVAVACRLEQRDEGEVLELIAPDGSLVLLVHAATAS